MRLQLHELQIVSFEVDLSAELLVNCSTDLLWGLQGSRVNQKRVIVEVLFLLDGLDSLVENFLTTSHRVTERMEESDYARSLAFLASSNLVSKLAESYLGSKSDQTYDCCEH